MVRKINFFYDIKMDTNQPTDEVRPAVPYVAEGNV